MTMHYFIKVFISSDVVSPTLQDLTSAVCPPGKPYKCLPYGSCYDYQSYCSKTTRAVEPCFPQDLLANVERLLAYCTANVKGQTSELPHASCMFACHHRFNASQLFNGHSNDLTSQLQHTEVIVITVILVNWLVSGAVACCLAICYKGYQGSSHRIRNSMFWRFLTCKGGETSGGTGGQTHDNNRCSDQEDQIELRPLTTHNSISDPIASLKSVTENAPKEKLQVTVEGNDLDMRIRSSRHLQTHQTRDTGVLSVHRSHLSPEPEAFLNNSDEKQNMLLDVDLSQVSIHNFEEGDEAAIWQE